MNYLIKKIGWSKRPEGFLISEVTKNDCVFWEQESIVYFGKPVPRDLRKGDILIQEVSSSKLNQNHAVIGVFECISEIMSVPVGPHTCEEEKGKWTSYIKVKSLTPKFSMEAKNRLERKMPMLLNLDDEWKRLGGSRLPYYAAGWAYITQDKAITMINLIKAKEQKI